MSAGPSLRALFDEAALGLPDARAAAIDGAREWSRGGVPFATLDGQVAELRLDQAIAAAAVRTPDATPSSRGLPWVRFAPAQLDAHAIDRAVAWFGLAYRRAIGS